MFLHFRVTLFEDGVETYTKSGRFGIRTVELDQTPSAENQFKCNFKINGQLVFLKGANWVSLDIMTGCITDDKYRKAIDMAIDANFNCLRVWGGVIFEKDIFFDICDEKGILVWQDFQFACADIPDDYPGFAERVIAEVDYQIGRLQVHPSFFVSTGITEKDRIVGIEDSAAGIMSIRLSGFAALGVAGGNLGPSGMLPFLHNRKENDGLMSLLPMILGK
ncbi:MAG: hypothetical protein IKV58_02430 [Oscillospiraceae bacterium]|nr:hypothetical protein [Oscillospiraceae bacterium]